MSSFDGIDNRLSKFDLRDAVDAIDDWLETPTLLNAVLSPITQSALTEKQKLQIIADIAHQKAKEL